MAETIKVWEKEVKVKDLQGKWIYVIAKQYWVDIETAFNARADANFWDDEEDKKEG